MSSDDLTPLPPNFPPDDEGLTPLIGALNDSAESVLPRQIGPYQIVAHIGEGGMGSVFRAEQTTPIKRTVAIKVIRPGFDSREIIARFALERDALARMDHPCIARVLDAGTTDGTPAGRPYFVMEYVPGEPITEFADKNRLSVRSRLELFTLVCDALAHAHSKSLVHRDIKSGNVLAFFADGKPTVKVIDFGIAKALGEDRLLDISMATGAGVVVGTPYAMSPEQAEGSADIDTRTDVYSLGALLYELLTGRKPFEPRELKAKALSEVLRIIREVDPPRPSMAIDMTSGSDTTVADVRGTRLQTLRRDLRRELEWIPMKAMRKDRERRYKSPTQFAEDIKNFLEGRPLIAGPESRMYRLRKFSRRNRAALVTAAMILLGTGVGVTAYVHNIKAEQLKTFDAKVKADHAKDVANYVTTFMEETLEGANPDNLLGKEATIKDALKRAHNKLPTLTLDKEFDAYLRNSIGGTMGKVGLLDEAEIDLQEAIKSAAAAKIDDHAFLATVRLNLADVLISLDRHVEAKAIILEAAAEASQITPRDSAIDAVLAARTGRVNLGQSNLPAAITSFQRAATLFDQAIRSRPTPDLYLEQLRTQNNLGVTFERSGMLVEAVDAYKRSLALVSQNFPNDAFYSMPALVNLGKYAYQSGDFGTAERLYGQAILSCKKIISGEDKDMQSCWIGQASAIGKLKRFDESRSLFAKVLTLLDTDPRFLNKRAEALNNLADVERDAGNSAASEANFRTALEIYRRSTQPDAPKLVAGGCKNLGSLLLVNGRAAEALPFYEEAWQILNKLPSIVRDAQRGGTASGYGRTLVALEKYLAAEPFLREAISIRLETGTEAGGLPLTAEALAQVCEHTGRQAEAAELRQKYPPKASSR